MGVVKKSMRLDPSGALYPKKLPKQIVEEELNLDEELKSQRQEMQFIDD